MSESQDFQKRIGRIEGLVQELDTTADPAQNKTARELMEALMELHGAGLERILEILSTSGESGAALVRSLGEDALVGGLLVLYNLHPDDFETRVRRGLDRARPRLRAQGARLELISIGAGSVHLKIAGAGSEDLQPLVREALLETAPDADQVVIEGGAGKVSGFVPLDSLRAVGLGS